MRLARPALGSAPTSPTGPAIILEALYTGLRQCQSESTNPVAVGQAGRCRSVTAGTFLQIATGRFRAGWGVNRARQYRSGHPHSGNWQHHRRASTGACFSWTRQRGTKRFSPPTHLAVAKSQTAAKAMLCQLDPIARRSPPDRAVAERGSRVRKSKRPLCVAQGAQIDGCRSPRDRLLMSSRRRTGMIPTQPQGFSC
jgi:hypothetical protein